MAVDLNKIVKKLKKDFGDCDVANNIPDSEDYVSTGNKAFDSISDGGIPFGYMTEFLGLSSSGKSLFIQQILANGQEKYDAIGILIDRENAYTNKRGEQLGIDNDNLILAKPKDVHTMYDAVRFIEGSIIPIREEDPDQYIIVAIDSLAAFDKDVSIEKADPGRKAKAAHESFRRLLNNIDSKVMLLIANQVTYKVGVMWGDPRTSTAGESTKYYSTVRFALEDKRKIISPAENNEVLGNWIGIETIKTRLGPCNRNCYLRHLYDSGIDYYSGYARLLAHRGYLSPKNKAEFNKFKQSTLKDEDGNEVNEHKIEKYLEDHPELDFEEYPKFNYGD